MRPVSALARASCTPDNLTCLQDPALATVTNSIRTGVRHAMHPGMHCSCTHPHHYRPCVSVWEYKQRSACPQMALDMAGNLVPAAVISGAGYPQTALSTTYNIRHNGEHDDSAAASDRRTPEHCHWKLHPRLRHAAVASSWPAGLVTSELCPRPDQHLPMLVY